MRSPVRKRRTAKQKEADKMWAELNQRRIHGSAVPYSIHREYEEGEKINHTLFGIGFVQLIIDLHKMKVLFNDGEKTMARCCS